MPGVRGPHHEYRCGSIHRGSDAPPALPGLQWVQISFRVWRLQRAPGPTPRHSGGRGEKP
jgi:hypothetical protein